MAVRYIFKQKNLPDDIPLMIAEQLYQYRKLWNLSLEKLSQKSGVPVAKIDALEMMIGDIDFRDLAALLECCQLVLDISPEVFPHLPPEYYRKYFSLLYVK